MVGRAALVMIHDLAQDFVRTLTIDGQYLHTAARIQYVSDTNLPQLVIDTCSSFPVCFRPTNIDTDPKITPTLPPLRTVYWLIWQYAKSLA